MFNTSSRLNCGCVRRGRGRLTGSGGQSSGPSTSITISGTLTCARCSRANRTAARGYGTAARYASS
jgi:hypothetical protein